MNQNVRDVFMLFIFIGMGLIIGALIFIPIFQNTFMGLFLGFLIGIGIGLPMTSGNRKRDK